MLHARGLQKSYGSIQALRGLDLDLLPGQIVGLVGNNGAGKTTTIKLLTGLIEPTDGTVTLDGRSPTVASVRSRIGYLPEDSPLYDDLTPWAYMDYFGRIYGVEDVRRKAEALFDALRLDPDYRGRPCGKLSKGNQRKVALARALLHDPDVLVLDEPRSGLDPATQNVLDGHLERLRDEGKAVLLSAHDLDQVERLCDRIVVLHEGRVVANDDLHGLQDRLGPRPVQVRADGPFPGSRPEGPDHVGEAPDWGAAKRLIAAAEQAGATVHDVVTAPHRLRDVLEVLLR